MQYQKGLRVRHPLAPHWGIGQVLENGAPDKIRLFFVNAGEKKLFLQDLQLEVVDGAEAKHPILDNLRINPESRLRFRSLPESIQRFLTEFPGGFYGDKFAAQERDYKLDAHHLMTELLGERQFSGLLRKEDYDEIYRRVVRIVNATNLIFPTEKILLKDGLKSGDLRKDFCEVLYFQLFGDTDLKTRFLRFCEFLQQINAAKWTLFSYFVFLTYPDRFMFVKPTVTQGAADICAFDIKYRPELNCATYAAVLRFSKFLKDSLGDLRPRDMIDVQSFMWCIRPDKN